MGNNPKALDPVAATASRWLSFRFSEEASLPGLTNHLGSLQVEADPIAVKHVIFPPVSSAEETTGMTTLDGRLLAASGRAVRMRWLAHAIERTFETDVWRLESTTAMIPGERAAVVEVRLTNKADHPRQADLQLRLSGRCRNTGAEGYLWAVPAVSTTINSLNCPQGLDVVERFDAGRSAVAFHNLSEPCASVQGIVGQQPVRYDNGRLALSPQIDAGASCRFHVLLVYATSVEQAIADFDRLAPGVHTFAERARSYWEKQLQAAAAAAPIGGGGGADDEQRLDRLSPPLRRLLDTAAITALYARRDYPNRCGEGRLYLTLFPRRGEGTFYLWDIGMAAPFVARIDPQAVRAMFELAAAEMDIYCQQMINAFAGKAGGWHYANNLWALFRMAWAVLCATRDFAWLDHRLSGIRNGQTVFEMLEELALAWTTAMPAASARKPLVRRTRRARHDPETSRAADASAGKTLSNVEMPVPSEGVRYPFDLADTGDRGVHLEACTTYEHQVASTNAGYVWMMRCLAQLCAHRGQSGRAAELRRLASEYAKEILTLFRPDDGFFSCGKPGGRVHASRVSLDHWMTMNCMPEDLDEPMRQALVRSFQRELRTPAWMHCVSPHDGDVVSGFRSDTTWAGSYPGFVALMAEGLCNIGYRDLAIEWLERISVIAEQGPFGQSYWIESLHGDGSGEPVKSTDELPQGTHWCEIGGASFGSTILHGVLAIPWSPFD